MVVVAVVGYVVGQSGGDEATPASKAREQRRPRRVLQRAWAPGGRPDAVRGLDARRADHAAVGRARASSRARSPIPGPGLLPVGVGAPARDRTSSRSIARRPCATPASRPAPAHRRRCSSCRPTTAREAIACVGASAEGLRGRGGDPAPEDRRRARHPARRGLRDGADRAAGATSARRERADRRAPGARGELARPRPPPRPRPPAPRPRSPRGRASCPRPRPRPRPTRPSPPRSPGRRRGYKRLAAAARAHDAAALPSRPAPRCAAAQARLAAAIGALQAPRLPGGGRCAELRIRPLARGRSSRSSRWPFPPSRSPSRRPTTTT